MDIRVDPYLGTTTYVVGTRQARPNLPSTGCPFCPGGLEAPEPYEVRWFKNRWPAMPDDRCEVVLYTPIHDATFWSLGVAGARKVVDLWADRTAELGARPDVDYVLVFENRGPEVGATIAHPHGQIYAFDHVPARPAALLANGWHPDDDPGERAVAEHGSWQAYVPHASIYPLAVTLAPKERVSDLVALDPSGRDDLAAMLVDVLQRLDRIYGEPLPYMMWFNQRSFAADASDAPESDAWLNVEIVSPWRRAGVLRYMAAAEVGAGEYFNPVIPEMVAEQLRALA